MIYLNKFCKINRISAQMGRAYVKNGVINVTYKKVNERTSILIDPYEINKLQKGKHYIECPLCKSKLLYITKTHLKKCPSLQQEDKFSEFYYETLRKGNKECYSDSEKKLLIEIYENNKEKFIKSKFPGRTWKGIREMAVRMGLRRNEELIIQDKLETTKINNQKKYGVDSTWQLDSVKEKSKQTNMARRGVEYALSSPEVRTKINETIKEKYGVENLFQSEEIKDKIKQTNIERYGVPSALQNKEIQERSKQTNLNKYGVENPFQMVERVQMGMIKKYGKKSSMQIPELKEKARNTNIERYGFPVSTQNSEIKAKVYSTNIERYGTKFPQTNKIIKNKIKETNLKRYGVDNPLKSKMIQEKTRKSLYKYGTQKCSKQQKYIANVLNGDINFPVGNCNIDILIDDNIAVEYDGGGHNLGVKLGYTSQEECIKLERKRDLYLKSQKFSIIRIISSKDLLPYDSYLIEMISKAKEYLKKGHSWIIYDIDNKKVSCREYNINYDFGKLQKIK